MPLSAWRTAELTRGTTLHKAAPAGVLPRKDLRSSVEASPERQASVGRFGSVVIFAPRAKPRCVCVLPTSSSKIMPVGNNRSAGLREGFLRRLAVAPLELFWAGGAKQLAFGAVSLERADGDTTDAAQL